MNKKKLHSAVILLAIACNLSTKIYADTFWHTLLPTSAILSISLAVIDRSKLETSLTIITGCAIGYFFKNLAIPTKDSIL